MKNFLGLLLLGGILLAIALAVRSGKFRRDAPGDLAINDYQPNAQQAQAPAGPQLPPQDAALIEQKFPGARVTDSGLRYVVRATGTGATPSPGTTVQAHYHGTLLDGRKFDSSYDRGQPFSFAVGTGRVIQGWDEAFLDMRKGERRTLIIPYWLAYGEQGRPPTIPPRATLVFEVELVDF